MLLQFICKSFSATTDIITGLNESTVCAMDNLIERGKRKFIKQFLISICNEWLKQWSSFDAYHSANFFVISFKCKSLEFVINSASSVRKYLTTLLLN